MEITTKKLKLSQIKPNPTNPRKIGKVEMERLVKSLQDFPEMMELREIIVDENNIILGGNMRYRALKQIGEKECIAKIVTGLTVDQKREFIIKDNSAFGQYDMDALANLWSDLPLADWGVDLPEDWLKSDAEPADAEPQIDKASELNKVWKVAPGDLWQIGEHRLLCGDSTKQEDVARVMDGEKADMSVTSPPYGVGKSYENKGIGPWFDTIRPVIKNIVEWANVVVWQIGDLYSTGSQFIEPTLSYSISMFADNGMRPLWFRIWEKQGINYGVGAYHLVTNKPAQQYEYIATFGGDEDGVDETDYEFIAAFGNSKYKFTKRLSRQEKKAWGYAGVWKINTVKANDVHVAMYPLELPTRVIKMHSDVAGIILDPFLGSGTTMVACQNLNRKCRGIEISPDYCAVILQRMFDAFPGIEIRRIDK
jgi:DNA modification methylase